MMYMRIITWGCPPLKATICESVYHALLFLSYLTNHPQDAVQRRALLLLHNHRPHRDNRPDTAFSIALSGGEPTLTDLHTFVPDRLNI